MNLPFVSRVRAPCVCARLGVFLEVSKAKTRCNIRTVQKIPNHKPQQRQGVTVFMCVCVRFRGRACTGNDGAKLHAKFVPAAASGGEITLWTVFKWDARRQKVAGCFQMVEPPQGRRCRWRRRHLLTGSLLVLLCLVLALDPAPVGADPDEDIPHNE
ncbi:voltage-gated calcium channel alpha2-delta subunit 1 [Anopheles sinensis]|uniref:Voltage-gated calcium channel alpha2-delta subunit 1 n=1 Tax=Anopheles sinensis TaxID=74873 RepID=A0A084VGN0_ANOSI|nr:voltage-gated calcium channel alpha2-delta subunit 1 [Anopheles sinensis]